MLDGNTVARLRHESNDDLRGAVRELCESEAQAEFKLGALNDDVIDRIADDPANAINFALSKIYPGVFPADPCGYRDLCATVGGVVEDRARELEQNHDEMD